MTHELEYTLPVETKHELAVDIVSALNLIGYARYRTMYERNDEGRYVLNVSTDYDPTLADAQIKDIIRDITARKADADYKLTAPDAPPDPPPFQILMP